MSFSTLNTAAFLLLETTALNHHVTVVYSVKHIWLRILALTLKPNVACCLLQPNYVQGAAGAASGLSVDKRPWHNSYIFLSRVDFVMLNAVKNVKQSTA